MFVGEWINRPAVVIRPSETLQQALDLMAAGRVRRLPVVEEGRLVGIITRSDIESAVGRNGRRKHLRLVRRRVKETMTGDPVCVTPEETIERAALLMLRHRISGLPVLEGQRVEGIITETDLFRALADILGFCKRGARMVVELASSDTLVRWLSRFGRLADIRTVVTYRDRQDRRRKAMIRLRGRRQATPKASEDFSPP